MSTIPFALVKSLVMSRLLHIFILSIVSLPAWGQISGYIYDESGETLPYVNVVIEGTTSGTASNGEGYYSLKADVGTVIIFRYIGFEDQRYTVVDPSTVYDVTLLPQAIEVEEIVIAADAEDPAYSIIRKAIAKRDYHRNQVKSYEVSAYAKGLVKMLETPEKIFGEEVGDLGGVLDTTGQGIVYLSESRSDIYYQAPDKLKEVMHSSKVSGSDGSFNINRLSNIQFDIYEEYFEFFRTVINPLADNAMSYYKFRLEGTVYTDGKEVNKIAVLPKSPNRPLATGHIYIVEDSWNVSQLDLSLTGKSLKEPMFDTIVMRQQFLPVGEEGLWRLFSQEMSFTAGGFGFKVGGTFTYIFSDYMLGKQFEDGFFGRESFAMEETALANNDSIWLAERPIPLTAEEEQDYTKKDSLRTVWESKDYLDSVDREQNKFAFGDFLFGYDRSNTYKKRYFFLKSPLSTYKFNTVEGHSLRLAGSYTTYDSTEVHRNRVRGFVDYGFADKRLKYAVSNTYRSNRIHQEYWTIAAGDEYRHFNRDIDNIPFVNTYNGLFRKINNIRLYRAQFAMAKYQREVANGLYLWATVEYENRLPLQNNTNYSFFRKDEAYATNDPRTINTMTEYLFDESQNLTFSLQLRWRPGQRYASYPTYRLRENSGWPTFRIKYQKGIAVLGGDTDYDKLSLQIRDNKVSMREYGHSKFNIKLGTFLRAERLEFMDRFHFDTNANSLLSLDRYMSTFKLMPHYTYSDVNDYMTVHYEHHFDGYIMDKIPLLKNLGAKLVVGASTLQSPQSGGYYEGTVGIDQLKIGLVSVFRFDYTWAWGGEGLGSRRGFFVGFHTNIGG